MIIGITGNTKTGKKELSEYLKSKYKFKYLDVDEIMNKLLKRERAKRTGKEKDLAPLLKIKHLIDKEILKRVNRISKDDILVVDYTLLEDSYIFPKCDTVIRVKHQTEEAHFEEELDVLKAHRENSIASDYQESKYHLEFSYKEDWKSKISEFIEFNIKHSKKVTIVVPIFNTTNYLSRCINSITNQSYRDIEILLINDGSTDESLRMCNLIAQTDPRIKIITQQNMGLSESRNKGIEMATGEYICFVDSDDYIENDMIENLLKTAEKTSADVVEGSFFIHMANGIVRDISEESTGVKLVSGRRNLINAYADGVILIPAWDKLYKKEALEDIRFDPTCFKEDSDFIYKLCKEGKTFALESKPFYHYVKRGQGSLTGNKFSERLFQLIDWGKKSSKEVAELGEGYQDASEKILYNSLVHVLRNYMRDHKNGKLEFDEYREDIQQIANELIQLLLTTKNVAKYRKLNEVLEIINELINDGILEKEKMPSVQLPCIGILWNSLDDALMEEALAMIDEKAEILECIRLDLGDKYRSFIDDIYYHNHEFEGIPFIKSSTLIDKFDTNNIVVLNLMVNVTNYIYFSRLKGYMLKEVADLKSSIRKYFKTKIREYAYDNIFHLTVDPEEYEFTHGICKKYIPGYGEQNGKK